MAKPTEPHDPAEPDLYWAGYSGWAMLPGLVIGVAVSAVVMLAAPSVGNLVDLSPDRTAFIRFWIVLVGWIVAGLVWSYRGASLVYRLTPRHLFVEFGRLYRPVPPIPLTEVTNVECQGWTLGRLFRVGEVLVRADGRPPLRLGGVFRPQQFAQAIRRAVKEARGE
jgi:membrane protein YdbS with pleckstrin-like domain